MSCKTIYVQIMQLFFLRKKNRSWQRMKLGHIILHRTQFKNGSDERRTLYNMQDNTEYQANLFAADLLLSDADICRYGTQ